MIPLSEQRGLYVLTLLFENHLLFLYRQPEWTFWNKSFSRTRRTLSLPRYRVLYDSFYSPLLRVGEHRTRNFYLVKGDFRRTLSLVTVSLSFGLRLISVTLPKRGHEDVILSLGSHMTRVEIPLILHPQEYSWPSMISFVWLPGIPYTTPVDTHDWPRITLIQGSEGVSDLLPPNYEELLMYSFSTEGPETFLQGPNIFYVHVEFPGLFPKC